jgi:hypothetical protein
MALVAHSMSLKQQIVHTGAPYEITPQVILDWQTQLRRENFGGVADWIATDTTRVPPASV